MVRVAINGYGRIGRTAHRVILKRFTDQIDVVAINAGSSTDLKGWMFLLKYDSVYGELSEHTLDIKANPNADKTDPLLGHFMIDGHEIPIYSQKDPTALPWKDLSVDVVIESTGKFTTAEKIKPHIDAGAKAVILSAPFKDEAAASTYVLGVNVKEGQKFENIISCASCTTNCITPVANIIDTSFGIEKAMMTTVHGYTSDQRLHDGGHKDYRRGRAAALNIIPTSTGATKAAAVAIPSLKGIFNGLAIRVPVPTGSLADFTFLVKRETTVEEVNQALEEAAKQAEYQNIFMVTRDPIVSSDIIGNEHSSIADLSLTQVVGGNMVKVIAWYDNEYGYTNRLVEETLLLGKSITS